jgi:hypothetical protein
MYFANFIIAHAICFKKKSQSSGGWLGTLYLYPSITSLLMHL